MTIKYYVGKDGKIEKEILMSGNKRPAHGEDRPDRHFSETLLKAYYAKECEQGSRFQSTYTKNVIKHVHETAVKRFNELGQEY